MVSDFFSFLFPIGNKQAYSNEMRKTLENTPKLKERRDKCVQEKDVTSTKGKRSASVTQARYANFTMQSTTNAATVRAAAAFMMRGGTFASSFSLAG